VASSAAFYVSDVGHSLLVAVLRVSPAAPPALPHRAPCHAAPPASLLHHASWTPLHASGNQELNTSHPSCTLQCPNPNKYPPPSPYCRCHGAQAAATHALVFASAAVVQSSARASTQLAAQLRAEQLVQKQGGLQSAQQPQPQQEQEQQQDPQPAIPPPFPGAEDQPPRCSSSGHAPACCGMDSRCAQSRLAMQQPACPCLSPPPPLPHAWPRLPPGWQCLGPVARHAHAAHGKRLPGTPYALRLVPCQRPARVSGPP